MTDVATFIPAAARGSHPRGHTSFSARCPQCGLISLDSGRSRFTARHCPRCLTGHLQAVEMPELSQAPLLVAAHTTATLTGEGVDRERE